MFHLAITIVFSLLFFPQQTPKPPFPYQVREALFTNPADQTTHGGTLTIPTGKGRHPAVLLLPGSGPLGRDAEMLPGHKPFWVIADHLSRRGFAVLRVDDRGTGKSTGDYAAATSEEFAQDALAALAWLKQQPDIDATRLGLVGHSQGGLVAPLVATKTKDIAFVVLLAVPALPDRENGALRSRAQLQRDGKTTEEIAQALTAFRLLYDRVKAGADDAALRAPLRDLVAATYPLGPLTEEMLNTRVEQQTQRMRTRNVRYFREYDPRAALQQLRVPVLALQGSLDQAVLPRENLEALRKLWREANHQEATIVELYGLSHLFQTVATGHPTEMMQSAETFSPKALELITGWLRARAKLEP
jgi:hypothetical protein